MAVRLSMTIDVQKSVPSGQVSQGAPAVASSVQRALSSPGGSRKGPKGRVSIRPASARPSMAEPSALNVPLTYRSCTGSLNGRMGSELF